MNGKRLKEILIALSIANLLFAASWRELLYPKTFDYHIQFGPSSAEYISVLLCVLLTALAVVGLSWSLRRLVGDEAELLITVVLIFLLFVAANLLRILFIPSSDYFLSGSIIFVFFAVIYIAIMTKLRHYVMNLVRALLLILSPFVLVTFSQACLAILDPYPVDVEVPISEQLAQIAPHNKPEIKNRVIWVIFDELDYRVPFELHPIDMPEFDRLKAESLMATAATSPAYDTIESIPSLLTGRPVLEAEPAGKRELTLQFADETSGKFSETPNIFSEAQRIGGNGAVVGWYHSYCRVIGKSLSACRWEGETFSKNGSVFALMLRHMGELIAYARNAIQLRPKPPSEGFSRSSNFEFFEMNVDVDAVAKAHSQRLAAVEAVVTNPNVDLAFIHLPFPHAPALFDRKTNQFVPELRGYTDNLALTDHVLGKIRNAMEQSGQWDRSTIVVSSDHPWRINKWKLAARSNKFYISDNDRALTGEIEDHRIPFFLKMPDQKETITYTRPFNTIVTHDLVLAVLKGEIFTAEDAKNWLDTRIDSERSAN